MKKLLSLLTVLLGLSTSAWAVDVTVTMNAVSATMTLKSVASGELVDVGAPANKVYSFSADEGKYLLTGYATDGNTVNGTILLDISETAKEFKVFTVTAYATNSGWILGQDYTISHKVVSREGEQMITTLGNSTTAGRATFLMLNGNSYYCDYIPSESHVAEGYMTAYKYATVTANTTANCAVAMGYNWTATLPKDAELFIGRKTSHYIPFFKVEPNSVVVEGDSKVYNFTLAAGQVYNYRAKKTGYAPQAGYFTMNADASKVPTLSFTDADFAAHSLSTINHDVNSNGGYETGDIFLRANEKGHISMSVGEERDMLALRSWELTDNSTNNYFIEPDFHYTVINADGQPDNSVITFDRYTTDEDPWVKMRAVGNGTAIVLVTYDAIDLNYYSGTTKTPYLGGEYWGAIWPENTGVYVVTVGNSPSSIDANMLINEDYNTGTLKNAGKYVDAEHDIFYYLDTEEGFDYTFTPSGVSSIEIAYPVIGVKAATYNGFASTGVKANEDGSYTLTLKEGRQIVRLIGTDGSVAYQVLTAKACHRDIINVSRPGSNIFQPGDQIKIQYSGLRHPANKMAGIYNMSGYVTYNGTPNGESLILGSGQYTFGSAASAQAVSVNISDDWDATVNPYFIMDKGVIQVNGYGDPIGNHRAILKASGRNANFTAIAHKTYFGAIPDIKIPITPYRSLLAQVHTTPADIDLCVKDAKGNEIAKDVDGNYNVTYGTYSMSAKVDGYRAYHGSFNIADNASELTVVDMELTPLSAADWNGSSLSQPALADGVYQISTGAELAWFANNVNANKNYKSNAVLLNDIDLAEYDWTPIGGATAATSFQGSFDGQGHVVSGLYIDAPSKTYQGLFGYVKDAKLANFIVKGSVIAKQYAAGIAPYAAGQTIIDRCGNEADITTSSTYAAGICANANSATSSITNCYNTGKISASNYAATIVASSNASTMIENNLALGSVVSSGAYTGNVRAASTAATKIANNYAITNYANGCQYETLVTNAQLASGEIAFALGEAWGQQIGVDEHPVLGGMKVYFVDGEYSNYEPIILADKSEYTATESKQYKSLTYTRTFGTTKWQPLYVPFASERSAWGDDVVLAKVTTDDVHDDILTITYIEDDETVEANTPYFIKALAPCDIEVLVENATLKAAECANITSGNITLTGTYTSMSIQPDTYYVLHSGELRKTSSASGYNLNPMRWYASTVDGADIKLRVIGEEKTEIATLDSVDASVGAIYSVDGARQNSLKSGVNIIRKSDGSVKKIMK